MTAYIGLGGNLGDASAALRAATHSIGALNEVRLTRWSSLYGSSPLDSSGPDYVNAVVQVQTRLTAPKLLTALQRIEVQAGRERPFPNAPRTLDLDLLLFGDARICSPALVVPHPRITERAFVLRPLAEMDPDRVSAEQLSRVAGQSVWCLGPL